MKQVLKWTVLVDDQEHQIGGGPVVMVDCQGDSSSVQVWTEEWVGAKLLARKARVYGTGMAVPQDKVHIGSASTLSGRLVWHVYGDEPAKPAGKGN